MAEEGIKAEAGKLGKFLTMDFHGLPVWVWGAAGIAGVVGGLWLRNRNSQSASPSVENSSLGAIPVPTGTGDGGGGGGGTTTTTTTSSPPAPPSYPTDGSTPPAFITTVGAGIKQATSGIKTAAHGTIAKATGGVRTAPAPTSIKSALHAVSSGVYKPTNGGPVGGYEVLPDGGWLVAPSGYQPFGWTCVYMTVAAGGSPQWVCYRDS